MPGKVAICGKARSGKSTVANHLVTNHDFREFAIADPIKALAQKIFPKIPSENFHGTSQMRDLPCFAYPFEMVCLVCNGNNFIGRLTKGMSPHFECSACSETYPAFVTARLATRALGSEYGRRLYRNVWLELLEKRIEDAIQQEKILGVDDWGLSCVVSDVRLDNEIQFLKDRGYYTIRLLRRDASDLSKHETELEIDEIPYSDFDLVLDNSSMSKEELLAAITKLVEGGSL